MRNKKLAVKCLRKRVLSGKTEGLHIVYIKHNNTTTGTRTFKPGSKGEELVPEICAIEKKPSNV